MHICVKYNGFQSAAALSAANNTSVIYSAECENANRHGEISDVVNCGRADFFHARAGSIA